MKPAPHMPPASHETPPPITLADLTAGRVLSPFTQLRRLLGTTPAGHGKPIELTIGEPREPMPQFVVEKLNEASALLGKYPPIRGSDELYFTELPTPGVAGPNGGRNRVSLLDLESGDIAPLTRPQIGPNQGNRQRGQTRPPIRLLITRQHLGRPSSNVG